MSDQADHFAGFDGDIDVAGDAARPVAEADVAQLDASRDLRQVHRMRRLGNAGDMVENVENALGAGRGLLGHRNDAAHRIEAQVEATDVGEEGSEHTDGDLILGDLPDAESPDDQEADFGEQGDRWRKQRPHLVDPVIDFQVVHIG
ncbi:MAG: hypothetical protein AW09_001385 [Candidatus Accumulibacter phosphatis]|uniref:Uncharacterized protein n=1 Tax=Candidatus Accumulibacter phosphatis TaxID=327160 RepID=A0A080LZB4_9PROT|nr:MAG: hypothetical protein AW09_001385 [Candidatus Accumulibacter phosphatis]